jgi:DNA-directed RNA polymerase specialized sigma24 family protein
MTTASEVFVVELARASRKANRFVRDLPSADRKDVIAAALLWCWENRHNYSLTTTLDTWFAGAVRNAYRDWARGEIRNSAEAMAEIPTDDATANAVSAVSSADALMRALPREYKDVARYEMEGWSRREMEALGISRRVIDEARRRIRQLRKLLPDEQEFKRALRAVPPADASEHRPEMSQIDREIESLDFPPPSGQDCPSCWRCLWYEGWLPGETRSARMTIVEPEVAKAVADTEARKVAIARGVRDGTV